MSEPTAAPYGISKIVPPAVSYPAPTFTLWEMNPPEAEKIAFVNPGDIRIGEMWDALELTGSPLARSFGICEVEELRARHELVRALLQVPQLRQWLCEWHRQPLPTGQVEFLDYFHTAREHNPHWQAVHELLQLLNGLERLPARLRVLRDALSESQPLEAAEHDLGQALARVVEQSSQLEGILEIYFNIDLGKPTSTEPVLNIWNEGVTRAWAWGRRQFSSALSDLRSRQYPRWAISTWNPLRWLGLGWLVCWRTDQYNARTRAQALRQMAITRADKAIQQDIQDATLARFKQVPLNRQSQTYLTYTRDAIAEVRFVYDQSGLHIRIEGLRVDPKLVLVSEGDQFASSGTRFAGFSPQEKYEIVQAAAHAKQAVKQRLVERRSGELMHAFAQADDQLFGREIKAISPAMDRSYRYFALENLYELPEFSGVVAAARKHRAFVDFHLELLREVAKLVDELAKKAAEIKCGLCVPEIVDDSEHVVEFQEIIPVQLLARGRKPQDLRPIRHLGPINGQLIGLTGVHGGGKTTAEEAIVGAVYLAQSGLPVFGESFRVNPKRVVGAVFIERVRDASACEGLVIKNAAILQGIRYQPGNQVLLVLDEIGAATQEASGLELGRDFLAALQRHGASVVFSTQILPLAQFAQDQLGATCYRVDARHEFTPGIGDGGMRELRQRTGFDRLLRQF